MSNARIGYGSLFSILADGSPAVYVALAEVSSITPPSDTVDTVDVTHAQSPGRMREFVAGLIDPGECSLEMNYEPGSASDIRLLAIKAAGEPVSCRVAFPNGSTRTFNAILSSYAVTAPLEDKMTATVGWRVTGPVVADDSP